MQPLFIDFATVILNDLGKLLEDLIARGPF